MTPQIIYARRPLRQLRRQLENRETRLLLGHSRGGQLSKMMNKVYVQPGVKRRTKVLRRPMMRCRIIWEGVVLWHRWDKVPGTGICRIQMEASKGRLTQFGWCCIQSRKPLPPIMHWTTPSYAMLKWIQGQMPAVLGLPFAWSRRPIEWQMSRDFMKIWAI